MHMKFNWKVALRLIPYTLESLFHKLLSKFGAQCDIPQNSCDEN